MPSRPRLFKADTTEPARPSFAAATASILLLVFASICSKIVSACWLSQSGTDCLFLYERAVLVERIEDRVVALLELLCVVVGGRPVELGHDRFLRVPAICLETGDDALPLQLADSDVVERDVVRRFAVEHEAVVIDRLGSACCSFSFDRSTNPRVEGVHEDHLCSVREALLALGLLRVLVSLCVEDAARHSGFPESRGEIGPIEEHVADRRLRVREQDADLDLPGGRSALARRALRAGG